MPGLYTGATGLWGGFTGLLYGTSALSTPPGLLADAAWSPAQLFAQGEQGAWYDPSDLSTMFQDSAGTTPVTAVEQPVGLIRDKSGNNNHASQTTSTSRPTLSARVNLLTYSEQFDNAAWTNSSLTSTATTLTETAVTASHNNIQSTVSIVSGTTYSFSVEMKKGVGATAPDWMQLSFGSAGFGATCFANFNIGSGTVGTTSNGTATITAIGDGFYRCVLTATATGTTTTGPIIGFTNNTNSGTCLPAYLGVVSSDVFVRKADLRPANQTTFLPTYQRIAAATDYDTTGFPYYLSFDGTDDFLVTGTINPGSVDKAQVFAGVRKLSDAAAGIVVETTTDSGSVAGGLVMASSNVAGGANNLSWGGGANRLIEAYRTYTSPNTQVFSLALDSDTAPRIAARLNGVAVSANSSSGTGGTGNFVSSPLYIGHRGGTTLLFKGSLYSLIVRFSATNLSDSVISQTETWVNTKTLAY